MQIQKTTPFRGKNTHDKVSFFLFDVFFYAYRFTKAEPATHQLKIFRMGAGGAEKDREFHW